MTVSVKLACACGCEELMRFSYVGEEPFRGQDAGLVLILTCSKCGEQLRVHQTSEAYRAERAKLPALLVAARNVAGCPHLEVLDDVMGAELEALDEALAGFK